MCQDLPYNTAFMPNLLNHYDQQMAVLAMELLLEHLECLVSRYVPSLRMMAGKQQAQSPAGMTSEVEVLRALKLLFEHHKALDEKQMILTEENNQEKILMDRVLDVHHEQENMPSANGKRPADGSLSHEEGLAKVIKLHEIIERQSWEQSQMKERLAAFSAHVTELEEDLDTARKDVLKFKDMNRKLKRDVREASLVTPVEPVLSERWEHAVWALLRQPAWPSSLVF
ncbi:liprin-alpha-1-like [Bubalus bubalis]|uniref:liprin-alpha-1-like n=1 Tax=Bubalus bubalis TaxID=89462 RepID=UPI001E1B81BE|nr:liprin-alpha-1-like [Bubalus bubalis]